VTRRTDHTIEMLIVMTRIHAQLTAATQQTDNAYTKERLVTITMHVPKTVALQIPETASTLQSLALIAMHAQRTHAMQSRDASTLLNLTLNNCKLMTNVTPMFAITQMDN
jgi:hypothetical protein